MVTVEGSSDLKNDGYMSNGVKVFALNLQKIRPSSQNG
jgi:hypothetical protein